MIRVGVRLARAGGPVRVISLLLGGALAVALLGLAWGLPDALYPRYEDPLAPGVWISPPQRGAAMAMATLMLAPVLMLLIATGRLSAVVRDQRLVSLRLIGVSKTRTLVAAVTENVSVTLIGALVGLGLLRLGAQAVTTNLPVEQPFHLGLIQLVVLLVGVVGLSGLLALGSARTLKLLPTRARRGGVAQKASWWRILPVLAALTCFTLIIADVTNDGGALAGLFLAGVATGALGIATAPALIARYSASLLRRSRRLSLTIAGRGIEADPTSATRRVAAVGVGIFAIFITAGVMSAWESVPQSRYATHNAERGPQEVPVHLGHWTEDEGRAWITDADVEALAATPEAAHVVLEHYLEPTECNHEHGSGCFSSFVGTCEQLAAYMPITGCSDSRAAWIDTSDKLLGSVREDRPTTVEVRSTWFEADTEQGTEPFTVEASGPLIQVDWRHVEATRGFRPDAELFIPQHLTTGLDLPIQAVDVIGPPGRQFVTAVGIIAQERGLAAQPWSYIDYDNLVSIRTMLTSAGAALVAVIVLVVTLSILDWLRESRRPRMRLFAAGVPRRVIARTYLIQFGIPLLGAVVFGGLLGATGIRAYEVMGSDTDMGTFNLPPTYWWLAATLVAGVLLAAALAGLAAREKLRPSDLRQE